MGGVNWKTAVVAIFLIGVSFSCGYLLHPQESTKAVTTAVVKQEEAEDSKVLAEKTKQLSEEQATEVSATVKAIRTNNVPPTTTKAAQDAKADASVIVPQSDSITLNQYNIRAYPKVQRQVSVGKATDGGVVLGLGVQKRIGTSPSYAGVGVDYNIKSHTAGVKFIFTW